MTTEIWLWCSLVHEFAPHEPEAVHPCRYRGPAAGRLAAVAHARLAARRYYATRWLGTPRSWRLGAMRHSPLAIKLVAQLTSVRPYGDAERAGPKFHSFPLCLNLPRPVNLGRGLFCRTNGAFALTRRSIMNKLSMLGIVGGAALLAAVPFSLQWSQENVGSAVPLLTVSHADAQTAGMVRRQARRAARTERRAIRRGVAPQ